MICFFLLISCPPRTLFGIHPLMLKQNIRMVMERIKFVPAEVVERKQKELIVWFVTHARKFTIYPASNLPSKRFLLRVGTVLLALQVDLVCVMTTV